jgi:hypothetical protein
MKKVNVRRFSRNMYTYLKNLPVAVYDKRTGRVKFVIISGKKGSEIYASLRTEGSVQSEARDS